MLVTSIFSLGFVRAAHSFFTVTDGGQGHVTFFGRLRGDLSLVLFTERNLDGSFWVSFFRIRPSSFFFVLCYLVGGLRWGPHPGSRAQFLLSRGLLSWSNGIIRNVSLLFFEGIGLLHVGPSSDVVS